MADSNGVSVPHLTLGKPRGKRRRHARADEAALLAADRVEGKRRAFIGHGNDVAVRHKAELDERLESIADAEHEAVAVLQQIAHRLGHLGSTEERRDELR